MKDQYKSISQISEGLYKDKGSRFIAFAHPVSDEDEIKEIVNEIKKKYHDARHHCYAYRLGVEGEKWRANDDGEPSGSAARPILGVIDSLGLSDILVVVVRYFGGIKLGVPGLINAYRQATSDALNAATVIDKTAYDTFEVLFSYEKMNEVMKITKNNGVQIHNLVIDNPCRIDISVPLSQVENCRKLLQDAEATFPSAETTSPSKL